MEGYCSTGQSPQRAVVPVEEEEDYNKCTNPFVQSTRYSCKIAMKLEFPRHIIEKYSNIKFNKNSSNVEAELFHADGQTNGHT
jgi:hypothetical protein